MEILNSHMMADEDDLSDENEQAEAGDKSQTRKRQNTIFAKKNSLKQMNNKIMKKNTGLDVKLPHMRQKSNVSIKHSQTNSIVTEIDEESERSKSSFGTDSDNDNEREEEKEKVSAFDQLVLS